MNPSNHPVHTTSVPPVTGTLAEATTHKPRGPLRDSGYADFAQDGNHPLDAAGSRRPGSSSAAHRGQVAGSYPDTDEEALRSKPKEEPSSLKKIVNKLNPLHHSPSNSSLSDNEATSRTKTTRVPGTTGTTGTTGTHGTAGASGSAAGIGAGTAGATAGSLGHSQPSKPQQVVENVKEKIHQPSSGSSLSSTDEENLARRQHVAGTSGVTSSAQPGASSHYGAVPAAGVGAAGLGAGAAGVAAAHHRGQHEQPNRHNQYDQSTSHGQYEQQQSKPKQMVENIKEKIRPSGSSSSSEEAKVNRGSSAIPGAATTPGYGTDRHNAAQTAGAAPGYENDSHYHATQTTGAVPGSTSAERHHHAAPIAGGIGAAGLGAGALGAAGARHHAGQNDQYHSGQQDVYTAHQQQSKPKQVVENIKEKIRPSGSSPSSSSSSESDRIDRRSSAIPGAVPATGATSGYAAGDRHHTAQTAGAVPGSTGTDRHHHAAPVAAGVGAAGLGAGALGTAATRHHASQQDQYHASQQGQHDQVHAQQPSKPKQIIENVKHKLHGSGSTSSLSSSDEETGRRTHSGAIPGATAGLGAGAAGAGAAHKLSGRNKLKKENPEVSRSGLTEPHHSVAHSGHGTVPGQQNYAANIAEQERSRGHWNTADAAQHERPISGIEGNEHLPKSDNYGRNAAMGAGAAGAAAAAAYGIHHHNSGTNAGLRTGSDEANPLVPSDARTSDAVRGQRAYNAPALPERGQGQHTGSQFQTPYTGDKLDSNINSGRDVSGTHQPGHPTAGGGYDAATREQRIRGAPALPERGQGQHQSSQFQTPYAATTDSRDSNIVSGHGLTSAQLPAQAQAGSDRSGLASRDHNVTGIEQSLHNTHLQDEPASQYSQGQGHYGQEHSQPRDSQNYSHSFGQKAALGTGAVAAGAAGTAAASGIRGHHNSEDPIYRHNERHNESVPATSTTRTEKPSLSERIKGAITGHSSDKTADTHYAEQHNVPGRTHVDQGVHGYSAHQPQLHRAGDVREKIASGVAATGATGAAGVIAPGNSSSNERAFEASKSSLPGPNEPANYHHPASALSDNSNFKPGYSYPPEERTQEGQMGRDARYDPAVASNTQVNRTTGLYADGGNFDASRPGAGHEASRLGHE